MESRKLRIALYWGSACGGCDVSVLDTNEFVLDVAALADIRLWPIAVDRKYRDVEAMEDGELDLSLFHGAIRNAENERMAKLLRRKSRVLVAFGSCAHLGGIPGLANHCRREEILETAYLNNPSIEPGNRTLPLPQVRINGATLDLPAFYHRVYALGQIVDVDYVVPGCPPAPPQVKAAILALAGDAPPPRGAVLGASDRALCDECRRTKEDKKIRAFVRPWQVSPDPEKCLFEQGILCAGPATRAGCGARCTSSGVPCRGCYGPPPNVVDQGAKLLSAAASVIDNRNPAEIEKILEELPDLVGTAYRFALPASLLQRSFRP